MAAENTLKLFDCYWYELHFFKKREKNQSSSPTVYEPNPDPLKFVSESPSMGSRSVSEQTMSSMYTKSSPQIDPLSPSSVLFTPAERLQTIFSGKVAIPETTEEGKLRIQVPSQTVHRTIRRVSSGEKRRKKKGLSKSLSDLEFSELKGFMDLGFVFSEEDRKDSSLSLIIPGLQRLGNDEDGEEEEEVDDEDEETDGEVENGSEISRPYLSEAWELKGRRRKMDSLWRVPATSSETDMKDYIKSWAHSVVSSLDR